MSGRNRKWLLMVNLWLRWDLALSLWGKNEAQQYCQMMGNSGKNLNEWIQIECFLLLFKKNKRVAYVDNAGYIFFVNFLQCCISWSKFFCKEFHNEIRNVFSHLIPVPKECLDALGSTMWERLRNLHCLLQL